MASSENGVNLNNLKKSRERLVQLEALLAKEKAKISKSRRNAETKFKILIGAFVASNKDQLKKLVDSEQFKAFLNEKDRAFISSAASEIYPDVFPAVTSGDTPEKELRKS